MKINIFSILRDHWATLYDAKTNRPNHWDTALFYFFPALAGIVAFYLKMSVRGDAYNVSITFFGIFIALLLNIQVAIFSIFQRKWIISDDKRQANIQTLQFNARQKLLGELNSNISYLILVSTLALIVMFVFYLCGWNAGFAPAVALVIYLHFILNFIMIVKRSHALFQKEYRDN